ncbi:ABC-2 type transport system permease protein [Methanomicrobium sp. W14]|uniref:ABC transporter permease n=1 Tax=Methanomicrobium sp. W14 TaxID=2817839 RepID=UPI001AE19BBC|nr:ABC transporter permease [Methanomicrobium sp. W14]MBP2133456.1 ABC-2 type transport system permease protein [Methanomicrobium sp. W14]
MADLGFFNIYKRDMTRYLRFKTQLLSSLLQPALWLAFFGISMAGNFDRILSSSQEVSGAMSVGYLTYMCAGIIAVTILFTNIFGGFILLFDKNWGILREILASPMPRRHLITGITMSGVTKSLIQSSIILVFGLILGVQFFSGYSVLQTIISVAGIFLFISLFAVSFLSISATIALRMDSPEGFQGVTTLLTMPLFFASNALYPLDGMPSVVQDIADLNPLTHLINGIRYFAIGNDFNAIGMHFAYSSLDILISFTYLVVFAAAMFATAWRTVNKVVVT